MTLSSDDIITAAQLIHDHGSMSPEVFGRSFDTLGRESRSRVFATVYALSDRNFLIAIKACLRIAADNGFFEKLLAEISANLPNQADLRNVVPTEIIVKSEQGSHEGVVSESGKVQNVEVSNVVLKVTPMIGVIRDFKRAQEYIGTCFLVGADLIMTAAHVIWGMIDFSKDPAQQIPGASEGVQVEFWNVGGRLAPNQPRVAKFAPNWLLAASEPCGTPPANLDVTNQELAATNHDFALVRIDEKIGDKIGILDINEPADAQMNSTLVVVGHSGGTQCWFDSGPLHEHRRRTGRLHHAANTVAGMSGAACLDKFARVVGLHEGTVKSATPAYNRSVHMLPIRKKIKQLDDDPLSSWPKRLHWLPAPRATEAWTSLGYPKRTSDHPILGRTELQEWVRRATVNDKSERLALVSGEEGSGKTFTGALMRARLTDARDIFVSIAPEVTRLATIPNLFERLAVAAGISEQDPFRSRTRPETGLLRHDLIPEGMEALDRLLTKDQGQKSRLWLFLDFGKDEGWLTGREEDWMAFLNQALQRDWMRIVVAGISKGRQADFHAALPGTPYGENLPKLAWPDVREFIEANGGGTAGGERFAEVEQFWEEQVQGLSGRERFSTTLRLLEVLKLVRKAP
ncbi:MULTISPECIES: serine protease [unclassified Bradyrhizobium]|uniref:trypsin-like peptidase domain-containing protein n=1 Tax=unclassified Bradyrhizobium TaxID=2631580 RepID=UPI001FF7B675|nr:serine protease [Bradyrhizobium sp. CW7]MCK1634711.1 serine protease [Bradyrhizobium sp. 162]